jgi:hypothetical protein
MECAIRHPDALPTPTILDKVQRAPDVLLSIKRAIDRNRMPSVIPSLFSAASSRELIRALPSEGKGECRALVEKRILSEGYPPAALMKAGANRAEWFDSYLRTYVERDLLQIKSIEQIPDFNRLITLAAFRTGGLLPPIMRMSRSAW